MWGGSKKDGLSNDMPDWVTAPDPGSMNTMATQQLTNPVTGETWTASSGGYSVKPTWDGDSFSQHPGKSYTVDPNNPNNHIGTFRNDYALQPGDNGYIGTGRDLLPIEPGTPGASGGWGKFALTPQQQSIQDQVDQGITPRGGWEMGVGDWRPMLPGNEYQGGLIDIGGGMMGGGNGYSSNPIFNGLDMSGFRPPGISTMDVATYTLNGEEHTGSGTYVSALEKYLKSTGQESGFSRPDNTYISSDIGSVNTAPTPEPTQAEKDAKYLDYTQEQLKANAGKSGYTDDGRFVGSYGFIKDPTALPGAPSKDYYNSATGESFSGAGWTVPEAMQVGNWFEKGGQPEGWKPQVQIGDNWFDEDKAQAESDRLYAEKYPGSSVDLRLNPPSTTTPEINNLFRTNGDPANNYNQPAPDFNMSLAVLPTENINPFADIPVWTGDTPNAPWNQQPTFTQTPYQQPTSNEYTGNLNYAQQQLAGTQPAGLEKQNLDYAMSQLGMMFGGTGDNNNSYPGTGTGTGSYPGFDAPWGGATADGGYNNPFTGTDSAGRTPDDPYYGGLSDFGTYGGEGFGYGASNAWTNWGRDAIGMLPGMWGTVGQVFGDSAYGINPMPGAGNYIPGTDTYIQEYNQNYVGPGDVTTDMWGLGVGEQRDMMIEQGRMGAGMFTGQSADPDQQFFENQQEALNWMNDGVTVADPYGQMTAEAVSVANDFTSVEGSSFGSQAEAQAVANFGFGSDEHMAALEADGNQVAIDLLTPPTAPVATAPEAPTPTTPTETISVHPETRLPTQPTRGVDGWTDPESGHTFYNEDHNWNEPSQGPVAPNQTPVQAPAPDTSGSDDSNEAHGGWGDSDAASDMDADSGWSGADSDWGDSSDDSDDSGGGWGDWGGDDTGGYE
jgi:hypothetical protein